MEAHKLLTRDQFREAVFKRDGFRCVFCDKPAEQAHHIIERRLWTDGGYYVANGASVCEPHHLECEMTRISVEQVREACGIQSKVLPDHLYDDEVYDKWGNTILANGLRTKGELFHDESVQKILKMGGVLDLFTDRVKFPRTMHMPWSPGMHDDDRRIQSMDAFHGERVILSVKMDGENTSLYTDYYHARSVDGRHHDSRNWVKNFHATFAHDIPQGWRICGENLFAKHSIEYNDLKSYFYGFSIWNEKNIRLGYDEMLEWFSIFGIEPVPVLYDGMYDEGKIIKILEAADWNTCEGGVLTVANPIHFRQYRTHVAKWVRKGHVQTAKHWMFGRQIEKNKLIGDS